MGGFLSGSERRRGSTVTGVEARQATVDLGDGVIATLKAFIARDRIEDAQYIEYR